MRRGGFCSYGKTAGKLRESDADALGLTPAGPALRVIALPAAPPGDCPRRREVLPNSGAGAFKRPPRKARACGGRPTEGAIMGCCDDKLDVIWERKPATRFGRRGVLKGSAGLAGLAMVAGHRRGEGAGAGQARLLQPAALRDPLRVHPRQRLLRRGGAGRRARLHPRRQRRDAGAGRRRGRLRRDLVRRGGAGLRQRRRHPPLRHHRPAAAVRARGGARRGRRDREPQ